MTRGPDCARDRVGERARSGAYDGAWCVSNEAFIDGCKRREDGRMLVIEALDQPKVVQLPSESTNGIRREVRWVLLDELPGHARVEEVRRSHRPRAYSQSYARYGGEGVVRDGS